MNETFYGNRNQRREERDSSACSFFHKAAWFSLVAPILAILSNGALRASTPYLQQHVSQNTLLLANGILSLTTGFLIITGFFLAIIALFGIPRHGTKGILVRSLISIAYNGLILGLATAIALPAVMKVRARESSSSFSVQIEQAITAVRGDVQKRLGKSPAGSAGSTAPVEANQDMQAKLDKAAKEYGGEAAVALKGASGFLHKVVSLEKDYDAKARALLNPPATSPEGLVKKGDVAARRARVSDFIEASRKLKEFIKNSDAILQEELKKNNVPAETMEKALAGYRSQAPIRTTAMKFWSADQRMAGAILGVLDILDNNWGKWQYDAAGKRIRFDDPEALKYYNFYLRDLQDASAELLGLHQQLTAQLGK